MVPAEVMTGRVPVCADTLIEEFLAAHRNQIMIGVSHWRDHLLSSWKSRALPQNPRCARGQRRLFRLRAAERPFPFR